MTKILAGLAGMIINVPTEGDTACNHINSLIQ